MYHLLLVGNYNDNLEYYLWLSNCYLAEISNIFLSGKTILKYIGKKYSFNTKKINLINNLLFASSYFIVRIFYIIPVTINYFIKYHAHYRFFNFIFANMITMIVLNLYWGYLIGKIVYNVYSDTYSNKKIE